MAQKSSRTRDMEILNSVDKPKKRKSAVDDSTNAVGDDFTPNIREKEQYDALERIGLTQRRYGTKDGSRNTAQHPGSPHGVEAALNRRRKTMDERDSVIKSVALPKKPLKEKQGLSSLPRK